MHDTAAAVDPQVHLHRTTFERIEGLRKRVAETAVSLERATKEKKEAQGAFDSAQMNLSAAVSDMIDEINGVSKLPLFDNQTDAIARAESDPIVQKLVERMLEHEITHVNALIVAGYTEDQRNELAAYLDALDERKHAEAMAADMAKQPLSLQVEVMLPPIPDAPAFLQADAEPAMTEEQADAFSCQLQEEGLEIPPRTLLRMTLAQRQEAAKWLSDVRGIKAEKGDALTMDDLPSAPSYLVNPQELFTDEEIEAVDNKLDAEDARELTTELDEPKKPARAPRRSSKMFKNRPRIVNRKKGGKR